MKKILSTLAIAIMFAFSTNAQSTAYKPFRIHISPLTYAIPSYSKGYGGGLAISIEPAYAINDNFVAGLRWELGLLSAGSEASGTIGAVGSYTLTGDYYFGKGKTRFFGGLGIGLFDGGAVTVSSSSNSVDAVGGSGIGFVPRLGVQLSHFRLAAEYNVAPKNMSYLGLKAAITIGGGAN
ncbi:MAG: hypothetical protein ACOVNP_00605 [Flavobacterium sp.]